MAKWVAVYPPTLPPVFKGYAGVTPEPYSASAEEAVGASSWGALRTLARVVHIDWAKDYVRGREVPFEMVAAPCTHAGCVGLGHKPNRAHVACANCNGWGYRSVPAQVDAALKLGAEITVAKMPNAPAVADYRERPGFQPQWLLDMRHYFSEPEMAARRRAARTHEKKERQVQPHVGAKWAGFRSGNGKASSHKYRPRK